MKDKDVKTVMQACGSLRDWAPALGVSHETLRAAVERPKDFPVLMTKVKAVLVLAAQRGIYELKRSA